MRKTFISIIFILCFSIFINAQGTTAYRFLEVIDSQNKPVIDATVRVKIDCDGGDKKTNEKGRIERFPIGGGDCSSLDDFTISKAGYYPFRDIGFFSKPYYNSVYAEQFVSNLFHQEKYKIELLKIPQNKSEKKILGSEQKKRELFFAVRDKNSAEVRKLLKDGISPNLTTADLRGVWLAPDNLPAIIYAAALGDTETIREFLKAGVNLYNKNSPNHNILLYYLGANRWKTYSDARPLTKPEEANFTLYKAGVEFLINSGADITATTDAGQTTLMISAFNGDTETVKMLLKKGMTVDQKDTSGQTALFYANFYSLETTPSNIEIAEILLKQGANPNLSAKFRGGCHTPLSIAIRNQNITLIKLLLDNKTDPNFTCENEITSLEAAIMDYTPNLQRNEIVKTLIEGGADVNFVNQRGTTILMFAVSRNELEIVETLLKNGATKTINICTKAGETALTIGRKLSYSYVEPMIRLLVKYGADPMKSAKCLPY